jgi:hypothetical protein
VRLRGVATDYAVVLQRDGLPLSEAEAICFLARSAPSRPRQRCFSDLITAPFAGMTGVVRLCREPSKRFAWAVGIRCASNYERTNIPVILTALIVRCSICGLDCRVKPGNDDNATWRQRFNARAQPLYADRAFRCAASSALATPPCAADQLTGFSRKRRTSARALLEK